MLPVDFPQRNMVYTKPEGWTDEQCSDLPVWKGSYNNEGTETPLIISVWQPSKEDIEAIMQGKPIYLFVTANAQPPISLSTECPFNS